mgnify:CR=1 FL=1
MNTRHLITVGMALLLLMAALPTLADNIKNDPGYIDLSWIEIPDDADEIQDIDLTSMLDDLADDAREDGEDDLADLITLGDVATLIERLVAERP